MKTDFQTKANNFRLENISGKAPKATYSVPLKNTQKLRSFPDHDSHGQTLVSQILSFETAEKKQMELFPKPAHSTNCCLPSGTSCVFDSSVSKIDADNRPGSTLEKTILQVLSISAFKTLPESPH